MAKVIISAEPISVEKTPIVCKTRLVDAWALVGEVPTKVRTDSVVADAAFLFVGKLAGVDAKRWISADDVYGKDDWMAFAGEPGATVGTVTKVGLGPRAGATVCGPRDCCQAQADKWVSRNWLRAEAVIK